MYELEIEKQLQQWRQQIYKNDSLVQRASKKIQRGIQNKIPQKIQDAITTSIKAMIQTVATGSKWLTKRTIHGSLSLRNRDEQAKETIKSYKKMAAVEGAATGAGGILIGLADFPLLLSIKIKLLYDLASIYGFNVQIKEERLFILHIFQLAFSSDDHKKKIFKIITNWDDYEKQLTKEDWDNLQTEYRDYIDFVKLLQLMPIIGAPVGAYANYRLLDTLGETAINCYRWRLLYNHRERLILSSEKQDE
ncbi:MAG: EcsC family protein [Bacillaceae bacterium]